MNKAHTNKLPGTIIVSTIIAIRFVAALLFLYAFTNNLTLWAVCIFVVAVFTDALDGHVARRLGGAAPFLGPYSAYSDAVADFFLVLAAFGAFVIQGLYPFWILLLIVVMFAQFILTSRLARLIYDPVGKYYGVFLFCAVGVTLVLPYAAVRQAVLVVILGFSIALVISRAVFLLGFSKKRTLGQDSPGS
ncbi:MAG: CDP-alcohol phosphatidyltransferase family protein [Chloroflexi bacterium]|nr:CDP-alcohol phosphatidyltransferase family protein [Chloroflexota bacterium]